MEEEFVYIIKKYNIITGDCVIELVCKTQKLAYKKLIELEKELKKKDKDELYSLEIHTYRVITE